MTKFAIDSQIKSGEAGFVLSNHFLNGQNCSTANEKLLIEWFKKQKIGAKLTTPRDEKLCQKMVAGVSWAIGKILLA